MILNEIAKKKIYGMVGIAAKAGKVQSGEFCTEKSIKSGCARLCLIGTDASDATKKHFADMCSFRNIPIYMNVIDKDSLGHIIGRGMRASITIEDKGLADNVIRLIEGGIADE